MNILLGPALDGLAGTLPPVTGRELVAMLWVHTVGCEPSEPAFFPVRQTPPGLSKSAEQLLAFVDHLVATLRENFPAKAEHIEEMPLAAAFSLARSISSTDSQRPRN